MAAPSSRWSLLSPSFPAFSSFQTGPLACQSLSTPCFFPLQRLCSFHFLNHCHLKHYFLEGTFHGLLVKVKSQAQVPKARGPLLQSLLHCSFNVRFLCLIIGQTPFSPVSSALTRITSVCSHRCPVQHRV